MKLFHFSMTLTLFTLKKGNFSVQVDENLIGQRIEKGMVPADEEETFLGKRVTKDIIS